MLPPTDPAFFATVDLIMWRLPALHAVLKELEKETAMRCGHSWWRFKLVHVVTHRTPSFILLEGHLRDVSKIKRHNDRVRRENGVQIQAVLDTHEKTVMDKLVKGLEEYGSVSPRSRSPHILPIEGRTFTSLAQGNVNVEMVSQGASEMSVSCVIQGQDAMKALNLIHRSCLRIKGRGEAWAR